MPTLAVFFPVVGIEKYCNLPMYMYICTYIDKVTYYVLFNENFNVFQKENDIIYYTILQGLMYNFFS